MRLLYRTLASLRVEKRVETTARDPWSLNATNSSLFFFLSILHPQNGLAFGHLAWVTDAPGPGNKMKGTLNCISYSCGNATRP